MEKYICVRGAKEHNLKNVNVDIPKNLLVVVTGVSGSGKSSLAFDTIYAEGQRRYFESLSAYVRQFLEMHQKPEVDYISGLSPAIAIDQKTTSRNPRSTVSTATEIYDYMRLLYARIGIPYSPATGKPIEKQTASQMVEKILQLPVGTKIYVLAPIIRSQKGEHKKEILSLQKQGFERVRIDSLVYDFGELPQLDKQIKHDIEVVVDRLIVGDEMGNRLADSVETSLRLGHGILYIEIVSLPDTSEEKPYTNGEVLIMSEKFACPISGFSLAEIEPRIFSFNSPYGACQDCNGLGTDSSFDSSLMIPDLNLSLRDGAIAPWGQYGNHGAAEEKFFIQTLEGLAKHYNFSLDTPFGQLPETVQDMIINGSKKEVIKFEYQDGIRTVKVAQPFEGIISYMQKKYEKTDSDAIKEEMSEYRSISMCRTCNGYRLKQESLAVKIVNMNIGQVCALTVSDALKWFDTLFEQLDTKQQNIADRILKEIIKRLEFLRDVGLEYISLNRSAGTLSGGENQRIRLASQIGSGLSGVIYVLDEPSIGLHQRDNERLIATLEKLRSFGNTVIVVEHDEVTMRKANYLIDVGPGAGVHGGQIVAAGTPEEVAMNPDSITGRYLCGAEKIHVPSKRRPMTNRKITVYGARTNNLKNITVSIPLANFVAITGVSGSGKSSFTIETLYKYTLKHLHNAKAIPGEHDAITGLEFIDKVIEIDQSPIGRTPRSNPATYTGAFTLIRDWFAALPEAKARGYKPGRFSFNVKGGRYEACEGDGVLKIEMHFLPDVFVMCEECHGARYNTETLEVKYKDKSIADVLDMTVEDAREFFNNVQPIYEKLVALNEVGLGYMKIGQSATTLSGGEAQRVKLAKELSRKSTGRTLYILDEPTTGLHSHDVKKLLEVLMRLVDAGNTVIVIEHNLDVIKTADRVIDIGPSGGDEGGYLVVCGTPEEVAACEESITGYYLRQYLQEDRIPLNQS